MTRNTTTTTGLQAALLAVTPVLLLAALVWHHPDLGPADRGAAGAVREVARGRPGDGL